MARVLYASTVGNLMYVVVYTRLNIAHVVGVVNRCMANPRIKHQEAIKWLVNTIEELWVCHFVLSKII